MNVCNFIGRLVADPTEETTRAGDPYARFSIAVTRPYEKDSADFINCLLFGKTVDSLMRYVQKGQYLGVTGHIKIDDGANDERYKGRATLVVERFTLVGGGDGGDRGNRDGGRRDDRGQSRGGDRGNDRGGSYRGGNDRGGNRGSQSRGNQGYRNNGHNDRNRRDDRVPAADEFDPFTDE